MIHFFFFFFFFFLDCGHIPERFTDVAMFVDYSVAEKGEGGKGA